MNTLLNLQNARETFFPLKNFRVQNVSINYPYFYFIPVWNKHKIPVLNL